MSKCKWVGSGRTWYCEAHDEPGQIEAQDFGIEIIWCPVEKRKANIQLAILLFTPVVFFAGFGILMAVTR